MIRTDDPALRAAYARYIELKKLSTWNLTPAMKQEKQALLDLFHRKRVYDPEISSRRGNPRKLIRVDALRYPGHCGRCKKDMPVGAKGWYDKYGRQVYCSDCREIHEQA